METKQCRVCQKAFEITDSDLAFLDKVSPVYNGVKYSIPSPTLCPMHRQQRRMVWRNERSFYVRKCDMTGETIFSIYPQTTPFPVYKISSWLDRTKWSAFDYGRDFDFNRPFFEQFHELLQSVPRRTVNMHQGSENTDFCNHSWKAKDSYMSVNIGNCEDMYYSYEANQCKSLLECSKVRGCEFSAYCFNCVNCYHSIYAENCMNCSDVLFSVDCRGCEQVLFCSNLRNMKYHIFNKEYSKEDYEKQLSALALHTYSGFMNAWKKFQDLKKQAIYKADSNIKTENCLGDYLEECENCQHCFQVYKSSNNTYLFNGDQSIYDVMDVDYVAELEMSYENITVGGYHNLFCSLVVFKKENLYCDHCQDIENCFGCIGLLNESYCILNKQYTKEEYEALVPKIIEHMKITGEWGEFFPGTTAPFPYNDPVVMDFYPRKKEEAIAEGFWWREKDTKSYVPSTMELPEDVSQATEEVLRGVYSCECSSCDTHEGQCKKNYKIVPQELAMYMKLGLALPRKCGDCRYRERVVLKNPMEMHVRQCDHCKKEIETTYAPDRQEKIYCAQCYEAAVY